jgi:hypothetical protein
VASDTGFVVGADSDRKANQRDRRGIQEASSFRRAYLMGGFLIGFRNRFAVLKRRGWNYVFHDRPIRGGATVIGIEGRA